MSTCAADVQSVHDVGQPLLQSDAQPGYHRTILTRFTCVFSTDFFVALYFCISIVLDWNDMEQLHSNAR